MPPSEALLHALRLLLQARDYAIELDRSEWDFAVDLQSLRSAGLTINDLRWLLYQDCVVQAAEITRTGDDVRSFRTLGRIEIGESSCFRLTGAGVALAHRLEGGRTLIQETTPPPEQPFEGSAPLLDGVPLWNKDRRILNFRSLIVKHYKVPAPNQEIILATFEEEKWPSRIDDPLPPQAGINPKTRIHDTINSLNRNQKHPLLRFVGDGYGEGVCWEPAAPSILGEGGHSNGTGRNSRERA